MIVEILDLLSQTKLTNMSKYNHIDKLVKVKWIKEKEKWLNNTCGEIETKKNTDSDKMPSNIHEIIRRYGCIKSKRGKIIMKKLKCLKNGLNISRIYSKITDKKKN